MNKHLHVLGFLFGLLLAVTSLPALSAKVDRDAEDRSPPANGVYIVRMVEAPVVAYEGSVAGHPATKPRQGQKINPNDAKVVRYVGYLKSRHDEALAKAGAQQKLYSYVYSFNGFAAKLTPQQAARLASLPGVISVQKDELRKRDTSSTPDFLGLGDNPGGLWSDEKKGEGVIIGIVDGGIWPEHPSFSDGTQNRSKYKSDRPQTARWYGRCDPGEQFGTSNCNEKLIGARYFNAGWGGNDGIAIQLPWEYNSPRDFGGHGTHTASTAGGNENVPATGPAAVFGAISGIAPRARIAAYKVCWETPSGGSCFSSDSVAAIDQAVADGVDVINFSISGSQTNFRDPVEIAFLFAADAGVFVAASAGNSGPASSTVAHPAPWLTTVAAGTHNRNAEGSVTLGNGSIYPGASVATAVGSSALVDSVNAGMAGADPAEVELCYPGTLDAAAVAGKIVLCKRGVIARVDKSLAVQMAGGVGMVMYNSPDNSLNADFHFVPTVHVNNANGLAIKAYAATPGSTASIAQATIVYNVAAPLTASFSSRGPLRASGDMLKPDLIAPGQDILAGVAPPGNAGRLFDLYSGTSMSSPHVAGLAALLKAKHPSWTPMMIKSALMTTAGDVLDGGTPAPNTNPVLIFRQGAGHVRPNMAADPGVVYNSGWNDWLAFICATQPQGLTNTCNALWNAGLSKSASDLNVASIAVGALAGTQTVKRKVKNVSGSALTLNASTTGLVGFNVSVNPSSLSLNPGETKSYDVTLTRTTAPLNFYTGGQLTWSGSGYNVRSPVVVVPVALAAPAQVTGSYSVTFGYEGAFSATARGLVAAATTWDSVADDPTDGDCSLTTPNAKLIPVAIPAGTTYARFSLFDADVNAGTDLDLCVFNSGGKRVGLSGSGTSAEEVNLLDPAAGDYTVVVQGWGVVGSSPFKLHTWLLGSDDDGNMTVKAPATASIGATGAIDLSFSGLTSGTKYLGSVAYGGTTGLPNPTIVRVDVP